MQFTDDKTKYEAHLFCEQILTKLLRCVKSPELLVAYTELHGTLQATLAEIQTVRVGLEPKTSVEGLTLFCDGTIFVEDGTIGCGFCTSAGYKQGRYLGIKGTTNQAEYYGVIEALDYLKSMKEPPIKATIYTDSNLVVKQVNNQWAIKNKKLKKLKNIACSLLNEVNSVITIQWLSRDDNQAHEVARNCRRFSNESL
jgi:ribonuclease HI